MKSFSVLPGLSGWHLRAVNKAFKRATKRIRKVAKADLKELEREVDA